MKDLFDEYLDGNAIEVPSELEGEVERYRAFIKIYAARISYRPSERLYKNVFKRRKFRKKLVLGFAIAMAALVVGIFGFWRIMDSLTVQKEYAQVVESAIEKFSSQPMELPKPVAEKDFLNIIGFVSDVY